MVAYMKYSSQLLPKGPTQLFLFLSKIYQKLTRAKLFLRSTCTYINVKMYLTYGHSTITLICFYRGVFIYMKDILFT